MNLIDRYVTAVGKRLPAKMRADIETELRSTLQDMLEDRSQETGRPINDELVTELLEEYGPPTKIAATYLPTRYLIGPRMYPIFTLVLKIVLSVLTAVLVVLFVVGLISLRQANLAQMLVDFSTRLISSLVAAFGNVVLVFAILERVLPPQEFEMEEEAWDVSKLSADPDPDYVSIEGPIAEIVFTVLFLAVLNLYPDAIGFHWMQDGSWVRVPWLSETFFTYLPWINLGGALTIILNLILLLQRSWGTLTRSFQIGLDLFAIGIAVAMLRGPSLVAPVQEALAGSEVVEIYTLLTNGLRQGVPITLGIIIIISLVEASNQVRALLKRRDTRRSPHERAGYGSGGAGWPE